MATTNTKFTYVNEITADLITELFARNISEELRSGTPYVRPIKASAERYIIRSRAF